MTARLRDTPATATCLYLVLTLAVTALFKGLNFWSLHFGGSDSGLLVFAIMWCPALAALMTCRLVGRRFRSLAWRWPEGRYVAVGYLLPLVYGSMAYALVWALGFGEWNAEFVSDTARSLALQGMPPWVSLALYIALTASVGVIRSLALALGEEIGWRGFLVPELANQMSFTRLSFLSGAMWAAWHAPDILFFDFRDGLNRWYVLACFTTMVISIGFLFNWVTLKSGSLWPAALLHASQNLFIQGILDPLTRNTGQSPWFSTEFGIALMPVSVVFAVYFWTRRAEVDGSVVRKRPAPVLAAA